MNKYNKFRLILTGKDSAKMNMAKDETLVKSYEENDLPILRLYTWEKSFTIGVSQKFEEYAYLSDYKKNYAKRITGGGVLFHGHDLSYSLILPVSYMKGLSVKESYEKICTFILEFYNSLGLKSIYAKDDKNITLSKSSFCQVGYEAYDILVNGKKIGGNAQRRTKKLIFQHGSIPIKNINNIHSEKKMFIGNSLDEFDLNLSYEESIIKVINAFEKTFKVELEKSSLNIKEEEKLNSLLKDKYDYR